ncbi:MAG: D-xylose ABC transporter substrate-binding protein, partial [Rhodobacteraceae bacterium]|nr:D-xylose ABC transporter substrate-binding protein [Paracoccaceae bacterium]
VSVWKDARALGKEAAKIAVSLAKGTQMMGIMDAVSWTSPAGTEMNAIFLKPVPVTQDNLNDVVEAQWITKEALCQGVTNGPAPCN